jgi:hypothetical protein
MKNIPGPTTTLTKRRLYNTFLYARPSYEHIHAYEGGVLMEVVWYGMYVCMYRVASLPCRWSFRPLVFDP